ncbi:hypothetical protein GCM10023149_15650 [Mucilaginibacter gynuensis]|uniref:FAS1 domain-containing protein n=1 Tax=Mucilaginibacter gynuensis TaxID=1302236 RepID=A0ABP8G6B1_9SPHI
MKKITSYHKIFYLLPWILLLVLSACKHDDLQIFKANDNFRPGFDFVKNNYDLSIFAAAIEKSGLAEQLNTAGPFTILAPANAAFNVMGINSPADLDKMNPDTLKFLVQRHILNERLQIQDIPRNSADVRYRTLASTQVYTSTAFNGSQTDTYFDGSYVRRQDVTIANGTLHVLDRVMKADANTTVQDWLAKRPEYSTLVAGLKKFGFWDELATEGPYTVLAPKNEVFEAAGLTPAVINSLDTSRYIGARLFGCYVMPKKHLFVSDLVVFSIINGDYFYYYAIPNDTYIMTITAGRINNTAGDYSLGYGVSVRSKKNYPYDIISNVTGNNQKGLNNLVDNGLVQDLGGIMIMPDQAIKR